MIDNFATPYKWALMGRALQAAGADVEQGLARYEQARKERTTKVVLGWAESGRRFQSHTLAAAAREYVDREWMPDKVRQRYEWLFTYDVTAVPV